MLSLPTELLMLGVLVFVNGLLAMAETAVVSARKTKLRQLAREGDVGAGQALALAENPARFLALVEFWLTLSGMIAGVLAGSELASRLQRWLAQFPRLETQSGWLSLVAVTLGLTSFMLIFGELVPKRIGLAQPEQVAAQLAGAMRGLAWLAAPFLRVLEVTTSAILRLVPLKDQSAAERVGEDEVRALIEQGLHAGVFQRAEQQMVEGVLALDQLPVTRLMTPRSQIVFLNIDDPEEANWRKIVTSGHSYFPVFQGDRDHVVGLVAVKALWAHSAIGLPTTLKNLLLPPLNVPEKVTAIQLLEQFKKSGRHIAIINDEFGAVQGLVTLIDVMEAIVGDLPERGSRDEPAAQQLPDGAWMINATLPISGLKSTLHIERELPHESVAEYQTLGGFVVTQFGRIPAVGDSFEWADWRFEVMEMDRRRVAKVRVTKILARAGAEPERKVG